MATSRGRKSKKASEPVVEEQSVEVPEEAPAEPVDSEPEPVAVEPEPAPEPEPEPEVVSEPEPVAPVVSEAQVESSPVAQPQQAKVLSVGSKVITPTGKLCVVERFDHKGRCIVRNLKNQRHTYSFKDHTQLRLL